MSNVAGGTIPDSSSSGMAGECCQSIEWYAEGQARTVNVEGVQITVHFVGRKGRRARIAITAPAGAKFCAVDPKNEKQDGGKFVSVSR